MSKRTPVFVEIGIGLALTAFVAFSTVRGGTLFETVSLKTFDAFTRFAPPPAITDSVRIVAIDQESVENLGRWPWPRSTTAQLVDQVVTAGAKVIGLNVFLTDPDTNQGLEEVNGLEEKFREILAAQRALLAKKKLSTEELDEFLESDLANAKANLDGDGILAQSIEQAVNVVLPMYFLPGEPLGKVDPLPAFYERDRLVLPGDAPPVPSGQSATMPLEDFGKTALAVGHANLSPDADGTLRRMPLVIKYGDASYPSFSLQLVREFLKLQRDSLKWASGAGFELHKAKIPVDEAGLAYVRFAGPAGTIKSFSALDLMAGGLPEKALDDKIVLVGLTAPGASDGAVMVAPGGERITGLEIIANHIENILSQNFIVRPAWAGSAEWGYFGLAAFVVILVLPLMRARIAVPVSALSFAGIVGSSAYLFIKQGQWVSPAFAASLTAIGFVVLVGKRLLFTERRKEMVEAEGVETNKMLGLSFQGQGMLDLAFEKFRRCPMDDAMKELLYNLGLDMERKRMFTKAAAVYEHIATVEPKYKDIAEKIDLLKKAGEGAVFGPLGKKGSDATVVVEGLGQTTTLGRYEVMKELGRGAMGIVYLGRDPKINRQVAIKTLRFTDETDEEAIKSTKERFFREAESAGNLTHPNIIRIFDAGEDQDVAYIAMELLDGVDLKKHCEKASLLPLTRALEIIIQVAFGLDYAHKQGVVHRDIKPGNIMLLKDGTLRITDFGIARIQATSKTATGAVLGTPAYMSPEQVNGKKVDGRADIFSLGVTLFELITGEKPFAADTIAALLYRIANVDHTDPREFNPKLPPELLPIINKALAKDPAQRYQTAGDLGTDLRNVIRKLIAKEEGAAAQSGAPAAEAAPVAAAAAVSAPAAQPAAPELPEVIDGLPNAAPQTALPDLAPVEASAAPAAPEPAPAVAAEPFVPKGISEAQPVVADDAVSAALKDAFAFGAPSQADLPPPAPAEEAVVVEPTALPSEQPKEPIEAPAGFETTNLATPSAPAETPISPPAGFESTQLMQPKSGSVFTESDFLNQLGEAVDATVVANPETPSATPAAPPPAKGPVPFRIVQNNDVADNFSTEDAFLKALNQDANPEGPTKLDKAAPEE